jgi:16S rRNA (guanine527-N7)-methyltransferase
MGEMLGGVDVSRETIENLERFTDLAIKWTPRINLIAKSSISIIWDRHIVDSVQIYRFAPVAFDNWVDLGSGGGFPGIVMAIIANEKQPNCHFTLIESDQRKAAFLRTAARELELAVTVISERIEAVSPMNADVVSARALTALSSLLPLASRHLKPAGICLLHKGRQAQQEIAEAKKTWRFVLEDQPSITDPEARILIIQRILARGN